MITLSRNTFRIAEMVRASFPESLIVAGGPLPTLYPEHYKQQFDAVFQEKADLGFPSSVGTSSSKAFHAKRLQELPLDTYDGLFIQDSDLSVNNPHIHYKEKDIQSFPLPDRSDFDHALIRKYGFRRMERRPLLL